MTRPVGTVALLCLLVVPIPCGSDVARLGMIARGMVRQSDGSPCGECRVVALHSVLRRVFVTRTRQNGEFRLEHLPAGEYSLFVTNRFGNASSVSWVHDDDGTRVVDSSASLTIEEGVNVDGLVLAAPLPTEPVEGDPFPPVPLASTPLARVAQAPADTDPICEVPRPDPVTYPEPPDPHSRVVFGAKRNDKVGEVASPCNKDTALGCTETKLTRVPRRVPSEGLPTCRADGFILLPTDLIETTIELRPRDSTRWSPTPPDAAGCADILKPDCGGRPGYHSFDGGRVHECTHRIIDEQAAKRASTSISRGSSVFRLRSMRRVAA